MKQFVRNKIAAKIGFIIQKFISIYADSVVQKIRQGGRQIGNNVKFFDIKSCFIDPTRPWLLRIGNDVSITRGVVILTHDYSKIVLKKLYGLYYGEGQVTSIGNNVFIGMNSVILMGTTVGNNVIIGAGSVCHGTIPDNVVVAGNPARVICSIDEHCEKIKEREIADAVQCINAYRDVFGKNPTERDLKEFDHLFKSEDSLYFNRFADFVEERGEHEKI